MVKGKTVDFSIDGRSLKFNFKFVFVLLDIFSIRMLFQLINFFKWRLLSILEITITWIVVFLSSEPNLKKSVLSGLRMSHLQLISGMLIWLLMWFFSRLLLGWYIYWKRYLAKTIILECTEWCFKTELYFVPACDLGAFTIVLCKKNMQFGDCFQPVIYMK